MRTTVLLSLALCLVAAADAQAGKLSRARSAVRTQSTDDEQKRRDDSGKLAAARSEVHRQSSDHGHDDHQHGGSYHRPSRRSHGGGSFGFFAFDHCEPCCPPPVVETHVYYPEPVVAPTYVQPILPTPAETFVRQFAPYPYANGCSGLMLTGSPGCGQDWSGRVQFEFGSDFDDIDRTGAGFLIEGRGGLGIDFDWDSYTEDLGGGGHDELHVGEFDLLYRIAESDQALVRVGLGAAWLGDRYDTDFGVNFTLKADLAPADPIVLSGELDLGTLGDAQHVHAAGTVGVMLDRCEIYGGYDYRRIGDVEIEGPMVGLRIWF